MEFDLSLVSIASLIIAGLIGGFINTLAGGGSMLTLPALMMFGMPADIANATNRVGVFLQSLTGAKEFHRHDLLQSAAIVPILIPTLSGALAGSVVASYLPPSMLKPVLLVTVISMALVMLIKPNTIVPPLGTEPRSVQDNWPAALGLFFAGVYGGFVQAGVGFILIAALAGGLRYDLTRTNALKMVCTAALSLVALVVFILRDQVLWVPGLILASGTVIGALISVRFAIKVSQQTLKWILFVMVTATCVAAFFYR